MSAVEDCGRKVVGKVRRDFGVGGVMTQALLPRSTIYSNHCAPVGKVHGCLRI